MDAFKRQINILNQQFGNPLDICGAMVAEPEPVSFENEFLDDFELFLECKELQKENARLTRALAEYTELLGETS